MSEFRSLNFFAPIEDSKKYVLLLKRYIKLGSRTKLQNSGNLNIKDAWQNLI